MPASELAIDTLLGKNNILLVIPHAHKEESLEQRAPMAILGQTLAKKLQCYTVINSRYKQSIIDMSNVQAVRKRKKATNDFLLRIRQFKDEITENNLLPLVVILQSEERQLLQSDVVFGYGQGERSRKDRPHRPTLAPSFLSKIRMAAEDKGYVTSLADTASTFCGRESHSLNQLFRQKDFIDGFFDPAVRSLLLTISRDLLTDRQQAEKMATQLADLLAPFTESMPLVRRVALEGIDTISDQDLRYIFRVHGDTPYNDMIREAYIDELARSVSKNGLLHPLVLLQKKSGRYKILCGFRRFQAIKRLNWEWVEAKVFNEEDFTVEDFFNISLAENTKRRNLNCIEIGNFLESASKNMGLNNARLADQFGESLGIGQPGKKVAQSTIHKYRKLNQIRVRGESAEMISDVINDKLQFTIAAEVLAPIKDPVDRDALYLEIIKPLTPTRPQLLTINTLLQNIHPVLSKAIRTKKVTKALAQAQESKQKAGAFIRLLQQVDADRSEAIKEKCQETAAAVRKKFFSRQTSKQDFNITSSGKPGKEAITLHIRLKERSTHETLASLKAFLEQEEQIDQIFSLLQE